MSLKSSPVCFLCCSRMERDFLLRLSPLFTSYPCLAPKFVFSKKCITGVENKATNFIAVRKISRSKNF